MMLHLKGFVFNCYKKIGSSSAFAYLHANITNQCWISIVSVTVRGALVTSHGDKFICRNHMQIKKLILKLGAKWEQRDLNVCIYVSNLTLVDVLLYENITFHFVHTDIVASFHKFLHHNFAMGTIVVLVSGVHGEMDRRIEFTITYGEISDDIHTVSYNQFCLIFLEGSQIPFCAFKSWINFKALYQLYPKTITF
jgi:hypothetical protein